MWRTSRPLLRFQPHVHTKGCPICFGGPQPTASSTASTAQEDLRRSEPKQPAPSPPTSHRAPSFSSSPQPPTSSPQWLEDPKGKEVTIAARRAHGLQGALRIMKQVEGQQQTGMKGLPKPGKRAVLTPQVESAVQNFQQATTSTEVDPKDYLALEEYFTDIMKGGLPAGASSDSSAGAEGREHKFSQALLDAEQVLTPEWTPASPSSPKLPFFLACGTALGLRREGTFMAHDNDIDLGVFWPDLVRYGRQLGSSSGNETNEDEDDFAQVAVTALVEKFSEKFKTIDLCGAVHRGGGLEMRFQHLGTGVLVDLNLYYRSEEGVPEDGNNGGASSPYWWTATHYEESSSRKFGMYRYRHSSFLLKPFQLHDKLIPASHASRTRPILLMPEDLYLREYFGPCWMVPKVFDYKQGLGVSRSGQAAGRAEYRNIIAE